MDMPQKYLSGRSYNKRLHAVWFHLYEVLEQVKLNYFNRN